MRNSPIFTGLPSILNLLGSLDREISFSNKRENYIKILVCDMFEYLIQKKQDSHLETMLSWVKHMQENGISTPDSIQKEVKEELKSVLPDIFQCGIQEIDEPPKETFEQKINLLGNLTNVGKNRFKAKKEFPSLNELCKKKQKSILPSLFTMFLNSNDSEVETKSIRLITKLYSQYKDLTKQIKYLEIIFDRDESTIYGFLSDLINAAQYLIEKCEVN